MPAAAGSRLLMDERPLYLIPSLARHHGLLGALLLQQLHYRLISSGGFDALGRHWTYQSAEGLAGELGHAVHAATVRRALRGLVGSGVVLEARRAALDPATPRWDRQMAYSIEYGKIDPPPTKSKATGHRANCAMQGAGCTVQGANRAILIGTDLSTDLSTDVQQQGRRSGPAAGAAASSEKIEKKRRRIHADAGGVVTWASEEADEPGKLVARHGLAAVAAAVAAVAAAGADPVPGRVAAEIRRQEAASAAASAAAAKAEAAAGAAARRDKKAAAAAGRRAAAVQRLAALDGAQRDAVLARFAARIAASHPMLAPTLTTSGPDHPMLRVLWADFLESEHATTHKI